MADQQQWLRREWAVRFSLDPWGRLRKSGRPESVDLLGPAKLTGSQHPNSTIIC